jgi:hypothetical protein
MEEGNRDRPLKKIDTYILSRELVSRVHKDKRHDRIYWQKVSIMSKRERKAGRSLKRPKTKDHKNKPELTHS